jgi:hypothetical protein
MLMFVKLNAVIADASFDRYAHRYAHRQNRRVRGRGFGDMRTSAAGHARRPTVEEISRVGEASAATVYSGLPLLRRGECDSVGGESV